MSGNSNKSDMDRTARQVEQTRAEIGSFRPEYGKIRQGMDEQRARLGDFQSKVAGLQNDPRTYTGKANEALGWSQSGYDQMPDLLNRSQQSTQDMTRMLGKGETSLESAKGSVGQYGEALGRAAGDVGTQRGFYTKKLTDPSSRGFDEAYKNQAYAKASDVARAGGSNLARGLNRAAAAGGMSNTGAVMRNLATSGERTTSDLLSANRDVNIADLEAKRQDEWNAAQGIGNVAGQEMNIGAGYGNIAGMNRGIASDYGNLSQGYNQVGDALRNTAAGYGAYGAGMGALGDRFSNLQGREDAWRTGTMGMEGDVIGQIGNTWNQTLAANQGEQGLFGQQISSYDPQLAAYQQKNRPGFWGNLGNSFASSLGKSLGNAPSALAGG